MASRQSSALDALIRLANQASGRPDPVRMLAELIRVATAEGADPYLVLGVLVEGAAHTAAAYIPQQRQPDITRALADLLADRFKAYGL